MKSGEVVLALLGHFVPSLSGRFRLLVLGSAASPSVLRQARLPKQLALGSPRRVFRSGFAGSLVYSWPLAAIVICSC